MDFGPKGQVNDAYGNLMICTYKVRTASTNADLHALLKTAGSINYLVIALKETKSRKTEVRQLSDGTRIIHGEKVPTRKETLNLSSSASENHHYTSLSSSAILQHQKLMTRSYMLFMTIWRKSSAKKTPIGLS
ncbi:unnamed protein product [Strongylus vulgaris]|uniref:Uncharacterized protein n=1 Tax=Strongylus vulgaris TaxID=40348 RepID=A0A3P7IUS5_STRVU|nr:unnamed protein product [Strongylus vulgaris]